MSSLHSSLNLPRSLGDNLVLRLAAPADTESISAFNARILLHSDEPAQILEAWTRDLMSDQHPTMKPANFVVVEDTQVKKIVSSTCLIPQVWRYEDIPFSVGRPELVATDPAYRRRGLVRVIFEAIHALSAAYGHQVQGITGIPWFYRQFGYEYALSLGGGRSLSLTEIAALKDDETEPFQIRRATSADIPALMRLYERQCAGKLITAIIDETRWRYELTGHSPGSDKEQQIYCICNGAESVVGYYITPSRLWGTQLGLRDIGVDRHVSLRAVLPSVLRALKAQGEAYVARLKRDNDRKASFNGIHFALGPEHAVYEVLGSKLTPLQPPYGWYIRLPDLPGFIRQIAPVLERRLRDSVMSGFTGSLELTFYRGGLRLVFEQGKLVKAADWQAPDTDQRWDGAGFPPLVFLQLLFGHRSLDELRYAYPDCWTDEEAALLLNALFPKQASWVIPLG